MSEDMTGELQRRLGQARRVAVLTGAGVSAESGVPTFRGADGLWRQYRAEDLATPDAFRQDPKLTPLTPLAHESHHGRAAEILPRLLGFDSPFGYPLGAPHSAFESAGGPCLP